MRSSIWITTTVLAMATLALTQATQAAEVAEQFEEREPLRLALFYGNAFQGFPAGMPRSNIGVGMEADFFKVLGGSLELGSRPLWDDGSGDGKCNSCPFQLSLNGTYYFLNHWDSLRAAKFEPFLTGGYTLSTVSGPTPTLNLVNFGGGVNWWFSQSAAVRLEMREHAGFENRTQYAPEIRIGITLAGLPWLSQ